MASEQAVHGISAEILEELEGAAEFLAAAEEAAEITERMAGQRSAELAEASEAAELADQSWQASLRVVKRASDKLSTLLRTQNIARTADGFRPAAAIEVGPAAGPVDAELRLGGRNPGLYIDGIRVDTSDPEPGAFPVMNEPWPAGMTVADLDPFSPEIDPA